MPILKSPPKHPRSATIQVRLEEEVRRTLHGYAEFIDANPSYVVSEALKLLFRKDHEFNQWLEQHTNSDSKEHIEGGALNKTV